MRLPEIPFRKINWSKTNKEIFYGESGDSIWNTVQIENLRCRVVKYSSNFVSDHWCEKGHILYVVSGELIIKLKDGSEFILRENDGFISGDAKDNPHMAISKKGAKVFILD